MKPSQVLQDVEQRKKLLEIIEKHHGQNPRYFGSVLAGKDHEGSDLDILIDAGAPMGAFAYADLKEELERVLGVPVDIMAPASISKYYRNTVLKYAQPILPEMDVKTMPIPGKTFLGYLHDMHDAILDVYDYTSELEAMNFNLDLREGRRASFALLHCLQIIGEASNKIHKNFPDVMTSNPELALAASEAYRLRNVIVHNYDGIDFDKLRGCIAYDLPQLDALVTGLLARHEEDDGPTP